MGIESNADVVRLVRSPRLAKTIARRLGEQLVLIDIADLDADMSRVSWRSSMQPTTDKQSCAWSWRRVTQKLGPQTNIASGIALATSSRKDKPRWQIVAPQMNLRPAVFPVRPGTSSSRMPGQTTLNRRVESSRVVGLPFTRSSVD